MRDELDVAREGEESGDAVRMGLDESRWGRGFRRCRYGWSWMRHGGDEVSGDAGTDGVG